MNETTQLYRSTENQMIGGVIAGLAEHYKQDIVLCRLLYVVLTVLMGFVPVVIYIAAWIIMPERPIVEPVDQADYTIYS